MRLPCVAIDALDQVGGQCWSSTPKNPSMMCRIPQHYQKLFSQLPRQAVPLKTNFIFYTHVQKLEKAPEGFKLTLRNSEGVMETLDTKAIIIAGGAGAFTPHKPAVKDIERFEGRSVFYHVRNKETFRGKNIVLAGGGDSAVDWALALSPYLFFDAGASP